MNTRTVKIRNCNKCYFKNIQNYAINFCSHRVNKPSPDDQCDHWLKLNRKKINAN